MPSGPVDLDALLAQVVLESKALDGETVADCVRRSGETGALLAMLLVQAGLPTSRLADLLAEAYWRLSSEVFNRYRFEGQAGRGTSAVVYVARPLEGDARLAIKVMRPRLDSDKKRFFREVEALKRVRHPGFVGVHDAGEDGDRLYLVMDWVDGRPLDEFVAGVDRATAIDVVAQVAETVAHLHAHGVLHRDLKPANILVSADGRARVVDLGLARLEGEGTALTEEGSRLGTPLYMSPEQAAGDPGAQSDRTDVYALGVILYEVLTGRTPHSAPSLLALLQKICTTTPPPPSEFAPGIAPALDDIALRALAKRPADRPTATEFAAALRQALAALSP